MATSHLPGLAELVRAAKKPTGPPATSSTPSSCAATSGRRTGGRANPALAAFWVGLLPEDGGADPAGDDRPQRLVPRARRPRQQRARRSAPRTRRAVPGRGGSLGLVALGDEDPERDVRDDAHARGQEHGERQAYDDHLEAEVLGQAGAHAARRAGVWARRSRRGEPLDGSPVGVSGTQRWSHVPGLAASGTALGDPGDPQGRVRGVPDGGHRAYPPRWDP